MRMRVIKMKIYLCNLLFIFLCVYHKVDAASVPYITDYSDFQNKTFSEGTKIGTMLGTVKAMDVEGLKLKYEIRGPMSEYVTINDEGQVFLTKLFDYETVKEIRMIIVVTNTESLSASVEVTVTVDDVNDQLPQFQNTAIFNKIPENTPIGTAVAKLVVNDDEKENKQIQVFCRDETALQKQTCQLFSLRKISGSNLQWNGEIILTGKLDYEDRESHNMRIRAFDGVQSNTMDVLFELSDVNDSPPTWAPISPVRIDEEEPVGTFVQAVTAIDSDITNKHPIQYELLGANTNLFAIDPQSGVITNIQRLDYDSVNHKKGVPYELTIKAREKLEDGSLGNDAITTSVASMYVTLVDINDNAPEFDKSSYTTSILEGIPTGSVVPGLQMTVTDIDSGTFNKFDLSISKFNDVFRIIPESDQASSSAVLYVKDENLIDFESGDTEYIFQVVATEIQVSNPHVRTATVTINIENVNDETPQFTNPSYRTAVRETAPAGTLVQDINAVDREHGDFGTDGIRYQLQNNVPEHFRIDEKTGRIEVAPCNPPNVYGKYPCIDYERKKSYTLTVTATDNLGDPITGRANTIDVIVEVLDENDNAPEPLQPRYHAYINEEEMETVNPLDIIVKDEDTVGKPITFRMTGSNPNIRYWNLVILDDKTTGNKKARVVAKKPILFLDAPFQPEGDFKFGVIIEDQVHSVLRDVIITVLDINNNAPKFTAPENQALETTIREDSPGSTFVYKVTATDKDVSTTGNGQIDITIRTGALGKFVVNSTYKDANSDIFYADIITSPDAKFSYDTRNKYEMVLVARDRGTPESKFGTVNLIVNIEDVNTNNPFIEPNIVSITVSESTSVDTSVYKVNAVDRDLDQRLEYFMTPTEASNPNGVVVDASVYRDLFRIDKNSGIVYVNGKLDRDVVSLITNSLTVRDVAATTLQEGRGALFIRITEYNDQAPYFGTELERYSNYTFNVREEVNLNSFVGIIDCYDEDDSIERFEIDQRVPTYPDYITLSGSVGIVIVSNRIDYETIESIKLTSWCYDSGTPERSGSIDIYINVLNINDNFPIFTKNRYDAQLPEDSGEGHYVVTVSANDIDKGDYGNVRYRLDDPDGFFNINAESGEITLSANAHFDREVDNSYSLTVIAVDSPNTPNPDPDQKQTSTEVLITITDINDNCPEFSQAFYSGKVPEIADGGTDVIDIIVTDKDIGKNAEMLYAIKAGSGDPPEAENLFKIAPYNGRLGTNANLRDKAGIYRFNITATDMRGENPAKQCTVEVPVEVEVQESMNDAPRWIAPPRRDLVIPVLEEQYEGMFVYHCLAEDGNTGPSGIVDYYFAGRNNELITRTPEFNINRVTGVIRAEVIFDREETDYYFLTLMARDQGNPAASSETTLIIQIIDVNDNDPVFPTKDGVVEPLLLPQNDVKLEENANVGPDGLELGHCTATDADSDDANNKIYYRLLTSNEGLQDYIRVNEETCQVYLKKPLDFETMPELRFDILAYNAKNDDSVKRYKREVNPSILPVVVTVTNTNDNSPVFTESQYFACVSIDAPFKETILTVTATDVDNENERPIYSLSPENSGFVIDGDGVITNEQLFRYQGSGSSVRSLTVQASDGVNIGTADAKIFIIDADNKVTLRVNQPITNVRSFKNQIMKAIMSANQEIVYICEPELSNYIDDDGKMSALETDVQITAIKMENGVYVIYPPGDLVKAIKKQQESDDSPYDAIYTTKVEVDTEDDDFTLKEDAVLAVFIIVLLLIFLAIILLCLACYCIRQSKRKKTKKLRAEQLASVRVAQEPTESSFNNPVYHNAGYDSKGDEYAVVQKRSKPIAPVVIPAPENLEPFPNEEPPELVPYEAPPEAEPVESPKVEEPEPVIETEVLPDPVPEPEPEPVRLMEPEYEDRIETTVVEDEPPAPEPPAPESPSEPVAKEGPTDEEIEVEILENFPDDPDSPRSSPRESP